MVHNGRNIKRKKQVGYKIIIALVLTVIFYLIYSGGYLYYFDLTVQDIFFQHEEEASQDIIVIGVTADDLDIHGMWPWDRTIWATVLETINSDPETSPAVIGITVPFFGSSQPVSDALLAEQVLRDNVILSCVGDLETVVVTSNNGLQSETKTKVNDITYPYLYPNGELNVAHSNIVVDSDGILRYGLYRIQTEQGGMINSISYEAFQKYQEYKGDNTVFEPKVDENDLWYLDYTATSGTYYKYSVADIINGNFNQEDLTGKIVLIGVYDQTLMDYYKTSIDHSENMYGIEFIANCIEAMIRGTEIRLVNQNTEIMLLLGSTFVVTFMALYLQFYIVTICVVILCITGSAIIYATYSNASILYPPFFFLFALLTSYILAVGFNYWLEWYTRKHVTNIFRQYVDPKVLETLIESNSESLHSVGATTSIAVLFVDIRGFTTISEKLDAQTVVEILNEFLSLTDICIKKNEGTLDKFIGDCAMAFWGAPNKVEDPIYLACRAAREMIEYSAELSGRIYEKYNVQVSFGVGIHYGTAVVGNVGSKTRLDYTAIGDTVNTAARLESIAPRNTIYVSEVVANGLNKRATLEKLDEKLPLKGKKEPLSVYILQDIY
ncbi:MAG: adenylate/guanylate cyclase domain-containing protein [Eubacteriales bacterium]